VKLAIDQINTLVRLRNDICVLTYIINVLGGAQQKQKSNSIEETSNIIDELIAHTEIECTLETKI